MRIFLLADRRLERDGFLRNLQHLADLADRNVHPLGDFFRGRLAAKFLHERPRRTNQLVDRLDHVDRNTNRACLVRDRAGNGLTDPPRGIGRELVPAPILELVDRLHQADVPFLNQIEELQPAVRVFLRDRYDESEVRFDEFLLRLLRLILAAQNRLERRLQLRRLLLERVGHAFELETLILDLLEEVLLVFFAELLLLVLRMEQPIDTLDFALDRLDAFDGLFHLVDEAALDRLGEFDFADPLRDFDARAHGRPARLAVLSLVPRSRALGRFVEFFLQLLGGEIRLAHRVDLLLHLTRPLRDALVGDLFVVEDDELPDRPVTGVQGVAQLNDLARDERRARDRFDHREFAALDAPRDFDLAFAREERHGAHLAQIHPDGIVGFVERSGSEVELELFGP